MSSLLQAMDGWRLLKKPQRDIVLDHLHRLRDSSPDAQRDAFAAAIALLEAGAA